jgi:hypothetical protein
MSGWLDIMEMNKEDIERKIKEVHKKRDENE